MVYGSETWALTSENMQRLERTETQMARWMVGVSLKDRNRTSEVLERLGLDSITLVMTRARLRWFGHVYRKEQGDWVKRIKDLNIEGRRPPGRPQKSWNELVESDLRELRLRPTDAADRDGWRRAIREITSNLGPPRRRTLN